MPIEALVTCLFGVIVLQYLERFFDRRRTAVQVERLIDKVNSRNYAEWAQTEQQLKSPLKETKAVTPDEPTEDEILNGLNGMFGL